MTREYKAKFINAAFDTEKEKFVSFLNSEIGEHEDMAIYDSPDEGVSNAFIKNKTRDDLKLFWTRTIL